MVYSGGVAIGSKIGDLEFIRAGGSLAKGVSFSGGGELSLPTLSLGATLKGFAAFDQIDLTGLGFSAGAKPTFTGGTLTVASRANHAALSLPAAIRQPTSQYPTMAPAAGGTLVKTAGVLMSAVSAISAALHLHRRRCTWRRGEWPRS